MENIKKVTGVIEFIDRKGNLTNLKAFAILNMAGDEVVSAIPVEILEGGQVIFHQVIKDDEFKVIFIGGDTIDHLMDLIPLEKPKAEDKADEVTVDDFSSADEATDETDLFSSLKKSMIEDKIDDRNF